MENIRMEIYMTVNVHIVVLCIMTRYGCFGRTYCPYILPGKWRLCTAPKC